MLDKFTITKGRDKVKKLEQAISRAKESLIKKCARRGMYENFGDNEVDKLTDKFIGSGDYSSVEKKEARVLINEFFEWCMSYEVKK